MVIVDRLPQLPGVASLARSDGRWPDVGRVAGPQGYGWRQVSAAVARGVPEGRAELTTPTRAVFAAKAVVATTPAEAPTRPDSIDSAGLRIVVLVVLVIISLAGLGFIAIGVLRMRGR
jgi:hypothetical protein